MSAAERSREPKHPRRFEKNKNMVDAAYPNGHPPTRMTELRGAAARRLRCNDCAAGVPAGGAVGTG